MKRLNQLIILIFSVFLLISCSNNGSIIRENPTQQNSTNKVATNTSSKEDKKTSSKRDITQETIEYILNGQADKAEAEKIKWSEAFLAKVNIETVYKDYLSAGGNSEDIQSFAMYLTLNAPVSDDWESMFATDLMNIYNEKVIRIEHLEEDLYQAYIQKDGAEIPYVVVNRRTGYFHG